uniref:Uncharacterized protein n=1 Tax=Biomphalaria glabrata TaxID=6526 RepID=A0A2C9KEY6_BIOGL
MSMMADTSHGSAFALSNALKHLKEEIDGTDLLTQQCEDFQVSNIKIEKIEADQSVLCRQQSENYPCALNSDLKDGHEENTVKQEIEMNDCTDSNKPWTFAPKLLEVSMKADNSLCPVPILMPGNTTVPEVFIQEIESKK